MSLNLALTPSKASSALATTLKGLLDKEKKPSTVLNALQRLEFGLLQRYLADMECTSKVDEQSFRDLCMYALVRKMTTTSDRVGMTEAQAAAAKAFKLKDSGSARNAHNKYSKDPAAAAGKLQMFFELCHGTTTQVSNEWAVPLDENKPMDERLMAALALAKELQGRAEAAEKANAVLVSRAEAAEKENAVLVSRAETAEKENAVLVSRAETAEKENAALKEHVKSNNKKPAPRQPRKRTGLMADSSSSSEEEDLVDYARRMGLARQEKQPPAEAQNKFDDLDQFRFRVWGLFVVCQ